MNLKNYKLYAGDSWTLKETLVDYPASQGNSLNILIKFRTNPAVLLEYTADGDSFLCNKTSADTANLPSGDYSYQAFITNNGNKQTIETGVIHIYPNLNTSDADARSYWQKVRDDLRDAYERMAGKEFIEATINGRTVRYDRAQLLKELNYAEYKCSDNGRIKKIFVRM